MDKGKTATDADIEAVSNKPTHQMSIGSDGGSRPVPDPTTLTTEQTRVAVAALKELLMTRMDAMDKAMEVFNVLVPSNADRLVERLKELHESKFTDLEKHLNVRFDTLVKDRELVSDAMRIRFDGMDKAIVLLQDIADKFPLRVDEKIAALKQLHEGNFANIQTQFLERDTRTDQSAQQTAKAVDAALQAAEKAVGKQNESFTLSINKSEQGTTKQLDQLGTLITATKDALTVMITDVKDRVTRVESEDRGSKEVVADRRGASNNIVGIIGAVVGIGGVALSVLVILLTRHAG